MSKLGVNKTKVRVEKVNGQSTEKRRDNQKQKPKKEIGGVRNRCTKGGVYRQKYAKTTVKHSSHLNIRSKMTG